MASYVYANFQLDGSGLVLQTVDTLTVRFKQYSSITDKIRQILELVILGFYGYYFMKEFWKLKDQYEQASREDKVMQEREKNREAQKKKKAVENSPAKHLEESNKKE